jgi:methylthioribose-1-phosphate isomerase
MLVHGNHVRTIWTPEGDPSVVRTIDQRLLPFTFATHDMRTLEDAVAAIRDMIVRGAPLIGVTAAYGLYLAARATPDDPSFGDHLTAAAARLKGARPTAVNLAWAVDRQLALALGEPSPEAARTALLHGAEAMADEDAERCRMIGEHGLPIIEAMARAKGGAPVNILTHCNAGWLACVDHGTATAPIYLAHEGGIPIDVWVDETRPRNQGARLTAWELGNHGVPHTVIADNTGGHLMQHGRVDMVIVGCDRATATGDICNKIGTYLKALAARDNGIPFYAALPSSTFDWSLNDGIAEIPIEERSEDELRYMEGVDEKGEHLRVTTMPESSRAANYGFDVTPARLVTGLITERGICEARREDIARLFPEMTR